MNLMSNATTTNEKSGPSSSVTMDKKLNIFVCPATGGQHNVVISTSDSISELKRIISRQCHIPQERLKLLFKEKILDEGKVSDYNLHEGCKISLIPAMKCGFSSTVQGPQQSIIQAIEGLSDEQIDDFLSARAPLTLALRAGDHIMFVQLYVQHYVAEADTPLNHTKSIPVSERSCNCQQWKCYHVIRQMIDATTSNVDSSSSNGAPSSSSQTSSRVPPEEKDLQKGSSPIRTRTYGKITSGIGSLTNPGSFGTGSRFLRQMQRLRRLCGGHQQCVAYSSKEVASEISSIVHASRHSSTGEGRSSRTITGKHSSREHMRKSSGSLRHDVSSMTSQSYATRIDSVTAHGPGVFSGTFSGSLDSSVQDERGLLKRDPKTVLQILTELLTATEKYEKQSGNVSVMSQLFKDHFTSLSTSSQIDDSAASSTSASQPKSSSSQRKRRFSSRNLDANSFQPIFDPHSKQSRSSFWNSPFKDCFFPGLNESDILTSSRLYSTCRRLQAQQSPASWLRHAPNMRKRIQAILHNPRVQRLRHENDKTGLKMAYLRHLMDEKRKQKMLRKTTSVSELKPTPMESSVTEEQAHSSGESMLAPLRRTSIEVRASKIAKFSDDRQPEVTHETAETASV